MNKLLLCLKKKQKNNIPIWFMRQAGRYLPEFQLIRKKNPLFLNLCLNEKMVKEITLQPINRFDLDAAIIFSDILLVPFALGQKVNLIKNKGPTLSKLDIDKFLKVSESDFTEKLKPVYKSIRSVRKILNKKKALISFVGAPWTLLIYMLNRKSPKKKINLNNILKDKHLNDLILEKLNHFICIHAKNQINAGSDVVQIFDSWASLLPKKELFEYCYQPNLKITNYVKSLKVPVICFPKGIKENYIDFCSIVKPSCINIDYEINPKWIKKKLNGIPIQGGLDPKILLKNKKKIKKNVEHYLNIFSDYPYVFNLGHGILPETKPEIIEYVIKIVRNKT